MNLNEHNRTKVFVCYSHKDSKWLERLRIHLKPLTRDGKVDVWDDTMIAPGTNWRAAIEESINSSKIAILLVSADFLASDFISAIELPALLQSAETRGLNIIPVIISPSGFQKHPILSDFQAVNDPQKPLISLNKAERERILVEVTDSIKDELNIQSSRVGDATVNRLGFPEIKRISLNDGGLPITQVITVNPIEYSKPLSQPPSDSAVKNQPIKNILATLTALIVIALVAIYFSNKMQSSKLQAPSESESVIQRSPATNVGSFEPKEQIERASIYLDLNSSWRELTDAERVGTVRMSRARLSVNFLVRKFSNDAELTHRLGTSSSLEKPFDWSSDHPMKAEPSDRKCSSDIRLAYMLNFDIKHEPVNAPFNLNYQIDFWNAHNRQQGDWQAFYVSNQTKMLIFKIIFPKNKPYTSLNFLKAEGLECNSPPFKFENPEVQEGIDEATGAKTITWTIVNPETHYIYRMQWTW